VDGDEAEDEPDLAGGPGGARLDRWLWSVRVFKTRTAATEACRAGHVRLNRTPAKPAATVRPGDHVVVRSGGRERQLEVVRAIERRVSATLAAECVRDHTPPPPERELWLVAGAPSRLPGSGRPTKKDRRAIERYRGARD